MEFHPGGAFSNLPSEPLRTPFWKIWTDVYLHPSRETFARYRGEASVKRAFIWLISTYAIMILAMLIVFGALFFFIGQTPELRGEIQRGFERAGFRAYFLVIPFLVIPVVSVVLNVLMYAGYSWVVDWVAHQLFQGRGTFAQTFFLQSAVIAPAVQISLASFLPLGAAAISPVCIFLFILPFIFFSFYSFFLTILAVGGAQDLSLDKSVLVALIAWFGGSIVSSMIFGVIFTPLWFVMMLFLPGMPR